MEVSPAFHPGALPGKVPDAPFWEGTAARHPTAPFRDYLPERLNIVFTFAAVGFGVELPKNSQKTSCCTDCTDH